MKRFTDSLGALKNAHRGEDAFVLGNGPSIKTASLSNLRGRLTIGMNASTMLEREFGFTQTYYTVSDRRFLCHSDKRRWATSELNPKTRRVLRSDLRPDDDPDLVKTTLYTPHIKRDGWSHDLRVGFFYGCTTTMLAVQLAAYLGCRNVYLLGVDLRYDLESPRFYAEVEPQMEDAFTSVQIWNLANARREMAVRGQSLLNCSARSLLRPYLPYVSLDEVVQDTLAAATDAESLSCLVI